MTPTIRSLAEANRASAVDILLHAFRTKLAAALEPWEKGVGALGDALRPDHALAAYDGDALLGVAGFRDADGRFMDFRFSGLRRVYGPPSAMRRIAILSLFHQKLHIHELAMDGIAVAPWARGRGVGRALLAAMANRARETGRSAVRLHVIDGNEGARRLYERLGFMPEPREPIPWPLGRLYGFDGVTPMRLPVAPAG